MAELHTKECVLAYANLFTPQENKNNGKLEYSAMLIFNSMTDIQNLVEAGNAAIFKKYGNNPDGTLAIPFKFKFPWKTDSDFNPDKDYFQYVQGKVVINVNTNYPIKVVDNGQATGQVQQILNPLEIYNGVHAIVDINPFVYDNEGKGLKFYLNGVQKTRDGDKWAASSGSDPVFTPFVPVETEL